MPDPIFCEMHLYVGTKVPLRLLGIVVRHTGQKESFLFFYEYSVFDLKTRRRVEKRTIKSYIKSNPKLFKGTKCSGPDNRNEIGKFPVLPIIELNLVEKTSIIAYIIILIGCLVMLFEFFNLVLAAKEEDGSLIRSYQIVLFVTPLVLAIQALTVLMYKYYIKRLVLCLGGRNQS